MPEITPSNQEERQREAERQRISAIASIAQPQMRAELEALANARDARIAEVRERQDASFETDVASVIKSRESANRNPNYRGSAWPPARSAVEQAVQIRNRAELESIADSHNETIDERIAALRENVLDRREGVEQAEGRQANTDRLPNNQNEVEGNGKALQSQQFQPETEGGQQVHVGQRRPEPRAATPEVDWRRILKDPAYREEIQRREFRGAAPEVTMEDRPIARAEPLHPAASPPREIRDVSNPESTPTEARKDANKPEQIDWRRLVKDPEYRREVQAREFGAAGAEVVRSGERRPSITPKL